MSTDTALTSSITVVHGALWPRDGARVDVGAVREHLLAKGLVAGLGEAPAEESADQSVGFSLLVRGGQDEAPRVALLASGRDGEPLGPVPGPWANEAITDLVAHVAVDVELGGVWWDETDAESDAEQEIDLQGGSEEEPGDPGLDDPELNDPELNEAESGDEGDPDEQQRPGAGIPGDVLVSRQAESALPMFAHGVGSGLWTAHADGWTLVRCDEAWLDAGGEGWLPSELPALHLKRSDASTRVVEVLTRMTQIRSHLLRRHGDMTATVDPEVLTQVLDHELVDALTNPHLAPHSDLREVLETKHFTGLDARQVAAALQTPMDERWSARVLSALGVPALAGDVHEARVDVTTLPGARRVEVRSMVQAMASAVFRYYDAADHEVARRSWVGRSYAALVRTPVRVAALTLVDVAATAALVWGFAATDSSWLRALAVLGILGFGLDAVLHVLLAPRRFRQR